jgi:hypothetical protein
MKRSWGSESQQLDGKTESESEGEQKAPVLASLSAPVSPPRRRALPVEQPAPKQPRETRQGTPHNLAAIESGQVKINDHFGIISEKLKDYVRPSPSFSTPRLSIDQWTDLYRRNAHPEGRHFVIHQHDHPVAGPHYDLRLQFSESSSVSWSIMYGLPGDPNSQKLNRNAAETRVHCLWVRK